MTLSSQSERWRCGASGARAHRTTVLVLLFTLLALMVPAARVSAHAALVGTMPEDGAVLDEAPSQIVLDFTEPVGPVDGGTSLFGGEGDAVPLEARASGTSVIVPLPEALPEGIYVLQWRVISSDSHPIGGTVNFSIGEGGDAPVVAATDTGSDAVDAVNVAVQSVMYLGMFAAVGITLFRWLVAPLRGGGAWRITALSSVAAMIALGMLVPLTTVRQTGDDLGDMLSSDPWVERVTQDPLVAALVGIVGLAVLLALTPRAIGGRIGWWAPSIAGLVALLSLPIVGHTRSRDPIIVMILMDVVHVVVGALWFGGMMALMLALREMWTRRDEGESGQAADVVARYSGIAGLIVPVIAISGTSMALIIFDGWDALTSTTYGKTLIAKVAVVVVIVLIAAWNRFRLVPAAAGRDPDRAVSWLKRTVVAEAILLAAVLVLSGALVMGSPMVSGATGKGDTETVASELRAEAMLDDDHMVEVVIGPNVVGENTVTLTIRDTDGRVVRSTQPIELGWSLPERNLGPITMMLSDPDEAGVYTGTFTVPFEGQWEVEIQARIDRFTDSRTTIEIPIPTEP